MTPAALAMKTDADQFKIAQSIPVEPLGDFHPTAPWINPIPLRPTWIVDSIGRVVELGKLKPNWDTYKSPPPTSKAVGTAVSLLEAMSQWSTFGVKSMPRVAPVSGGGINFEMERDGKEIEIAIFPEGNLNVFVDSREHEQELSLPVPNLQLLTWLVNWL